MQNSFNSLYPNMKDVTSTRNLGSMLGPKEEKEAFAKTNAVGWAEQVKTLAKIAPKDPHAVYAVFSVCTKAKWTYQQRVLIEDRSAGGCLRPCRAGHQIPRDPHADGVAGSI